MLLLSVQTIRVDSEGAGYFGASRSGHVHEGVDLEANSGQPIYAPFNGTITRTAAPYKPSAGPKSALGGFVFTGSEYQFKIFYAKALSVGSYFSEGDIIGYADNVQQYYSPAMKNHIHVELRDKAGTLLDPTKFLTNLKKK
jgi:murein DD-endopeptidase MepM/ murein hydrolase activator NlpD